MLFPSVCDAPDGIRSVVRHQQRSVGRHGHSHRPPPNFAVVEHKASQEILIVAAGMACLVERNANHFIARARGTVPGTVLGGENVALIFGRELLAAVESKLQRSIERVKTRTREKELV